MQIQEDLTLGIDLGIASCGWAVIREWSGGGEIVALGVRTWDAPETDKERTPTNQLRRQHRGLRRVFKRRRQRMSALRKLFHDHELIEGTGDRALWIKHDGKLLDPWDLRAKGLDRKLSGPELAVVLGHIAKHRGFKSNSKRDRGANAPKQDKAFYSGMEAVRAKAAEWRSVGEMFARDEAFARRKRNRDGEYTRSILRDDQEREVRLLFDAQRRAGNRLVTPELEQAFIDIAFFQRPLADSEHLVGDCPFEPGEKRAAKRSYSFELFRFLSRLTALRIRSGRQERALTPDEIVAAAEDFGSHRGMTFKRVRARLGLNDDDRFDGVPIEEEGKRDVVNRSSSNGCAQGTAALRRALGEAPWRSLLATPDKLDRIAAVLTFREDLDSIRTGLGEIGRESLVLDALMGAVERGDFADFKGAGHISAKAARRMVPHLKRGLVYSEAAAAAGYDHAKRSETDLASIANPVARKSLTEAVKQVKAIVQEYGLPGRIHVELARDVGKSKEERDEIRFGIEKRNKYRDRLRQEFLETVGQPCGGAEDLLRFELWKEQNGRCLYTDREIHPNMIVAGDRTVEVDHILPWSRFGDDSFINKTLCFTSANQQKKGRTPYEWFRQGKDEQAWELFRKRVEEIKFMKGRKKRNYTLKTTADVEERFRNRNLNDTRYATRLLVGELQRLYPVREAWRVRGRPAQLTQPLRRGWGVQDLKKTEAGARLNDDRHHALDALVCAATTDGAMKRLTAAFQACEEKGSHRDFENLDPPWPGFLEETRTKLREVFVSRAERRRARGEAHAATVRQLKERDGEPIVFERKAIQALTAADLARVKDPERNAKVIEALRTWIEAGKPASAPPRSPKGDPISKVRLETKIKPGVLVRDGAADRGEMVRVDVFRKRNRRGSWEYFLVPIYPHQVFDNKKWPEPPNKIARAAMDESAWPTLEPDHEFLWSLYPMSFVEVEQADGTTIDGYFRGLNRNTASISVSAHTSKDAVQGSIGAQRLKRFSKFAVDRLGRRFEIERETRTWRGAACT